MANKVKFRVPNLAYWPSLIWPGAAGDEARREQRWGVLHEALRPRDDTREERRPRFVAEFGIGRGDWLRERAAAEPSTLFLGVDASFHFVQYAWRHAREQGLRNLFLAFGDARLTVLPPYVPAGRLDEAHYLFPDPWTRMRHTWRRMLAAANLPYIFRALRPGGLLRLRTDVPDYLEDAVVGLSDLGVGLIERSENRDEAKAVTRWERRKLAEGWTIGEVRCVKPQGLDETLRARNAYPAVDAVPLDLRGVAKHEPSILRNAGFEPLPVEAADADRPPAAARTRYGPKARRDREHPADDVPDA